MARNINLNSSDWCEVVFENKNKTYGAYEMRQTSSKRHILAFGCILLFTAVVALIPQLITAINKNKVELLGGYDEPRVFADLEQPIDEKVVEAIATPAPPKENLVRSQMFTPPIITDASEVTPDNEMRAQEDLMESRGIISTVTYTETDNTVGVDPGEALRENRKVTGTTETPFRSVEVRPQFPGGDAELMKFISSNLRYPSIAIENRIEGRVVVEFVVSKTGNITDIKILKGVDPSCDNEAIRVVKSMPRWVAGQQNGNAVPVYFTLPILFKLQ